MLDTARLREMLGQTLDLAPDSIHAQVVGEHGDSSVVLWSGARVGGAPLRAWLGWAADVEERIAHEVRSAAYDVMQRKGATNHAIGLVSANVLRSMLRGERRMLTVSRVQAGALGLNGVALLLPTVIGRDGGTCVVEPAVDETEREELARSAQVLRRVISSLKLD